MTCLRVAALAAALAALCAVPAAGAQLKHKHRHRSKRERHLHRKRELKAAVRGDCKCLNWKEVFTLRNGTCGQGYERFLSRSANDTFSHLKVGLFQELWEGELCDRTFSKLDMNLCVQQHMGEGSNSAQSGWCYVNSRCSSGKLDLRNLSTAEGVNKHLGLRMCIPGVDKFLYEKSPRDLERLAKRQGLDMAHLVKMAYPTMGESWEHVSSYFTANRSLIATEGSARMKHMAERGITVVWSSRNGLPPFGVTQGTRAWEVVLRPRARKNVLSDPNNLQVWANMTKFRCVNGCSGNALLGDTPVLQLAKSSGDSHKHADVLQLGAPWARGRGMVQMHRERTKKGEQPKIIMVAT